MEAFFPKLFRQADVDKILGNRKKEEGIPIGKNTKEDLDYLIACFNLWTKRVDTVIKYDRSVNGKESWISHKAIRYRGFTFHEFEAIFNAAINDPSEFHHYPAFNQIRYRDKQGIRSERERIFITSQLEYSKESYVLCLETFGFNCLLEFFRGFCDFDVGLPLEKMYQSIAIIAPPGSGKTILMESLFFNMTNKYVNHSFVLIDPHGDISRRAKIHRHLSKRCVYIDAFLSRHKMPTLNPFHIKDRSMRNVNNVAEAVIMLLGEVLSREGGELTENMTNMLEKAIYFLLKRKNGSTLSDLVALLGTDKKLFAEAASYDSFFNDNFLRPNNKTRDGLLNRVGRLLNSPILYHLFGLESTYDLEELLDQNKVVIFNLSGLGEMTQIAFGKLILCHLKSLVRKREKPSRKHTFCFVDEAHNFVQGSESVDFIISQLRGFGLHLVLANQYLEQYGNQATSIASNVCIKVLGGGNDSLDSLSKLVKLPKHEELADYEFFVKIRGREVLKFKSPDTLLKRKEKHYLTPNEEAELDKRLLERYYREIDLRQYEPVAPDTNMVSPSNLPPSPDLGLYINENG